VAYISARITSANRTFVCLRLRRCPLCLKSNATALNYHGEADAQCQNCDGKIEMLDVNIER
jgi:hypothetical protein